MELLNNYKIYLNVPFAEKDLVKSMGARWDKYKRLWYITYHYKIINSDNFNLLMNKYKIKNKETLINTNFEPRNIVKSKWLYEQKNELNILNENYTKLILFYDDDTNWFIIKDLYNTYKLPKVAKLKCQTDYYNIQPIYKMNYKIVLYFDGIQNNFDNIFNILNYTQEEFLPCKINIRLKSGEDIKYVNYIKNNLYIPEVMENSAGKEKIIKNINDLYKVNISEKSYNAEIAHTIEDIENYEKLMKEYPTILIEYNIFKSENKNPKTGRIIKIDGDAYKKIENSFPPNIKDIILLDKLLKTNSNYKSEVININNKIKDKLLKIKDYNNAVKQCYSLSIKNYKNIINIMNFKYINECLIIDDVRYYPNITIKFNNKLSKYNFQNQEIYDIMIFKLNTVNDYIIFDNKKYNINKHDYIDDINKTSYEDYVDDIIYETSLELDNYII